MLLVGFESTTPVFEGAKTVHASDRAVTLIGSPFPFIHTIHLSHDSMLEDEILPVSLSKSLIEAASVIKSTAKLPTGQKIGNISFLKVHIR
jgi:acyl-[acyl carrier protein]--UDP-N-acetylglucosamine O-acyltransferase